MTDPVFLTDLDGSAFRTGATVLVDGADGRHAATVRRIAAGERVIVADGGGRGIRGPVLEVTKSSISVAVEEVLTTPEPTVRITVAQALAKGDRSDLACEMMTELGAVRIVPWQASRSIVRWTGERAEKSRAKWVATVREATKQSRRLRVPIVDPVHSTRQLTGLVADHDVTLVLHEEATTPLRDTAVPAGGSVLIVVGPEGGISPDELSTLTAAGGRPVLLSDGVLRTSTAAAVAISGILLR